MKLSRRPVVGGLLALGISGEAFAQEAPFDGIWWGVMEFGGTRLRLRLEVSGSTAVVYGVDQGGAHFPVERFELDGDTVTASLPALGLIYHGALRGGRIEGEATQYSMGQPIPQPLAFGREPIPAFSPVALDGEPNPAFDGAWFAVLADATNAWRLRLEIAGDQAALIVLDQDDKTIPADIVAIDGTAIFLRFERMSASYLGELRAGRIVGRFAQATATLLDFERAPVTVGTAEPLTQARLAELRRRAAAPAMGAAAESASSRSLILADGLRLQGGPAAVTPADSWQLGSMTKAMTATLVARCIEAGALSWDDTIHDVLGPAIPDMREDYRAATLRHLCSHRAGVQRDMSVPATATPSARGGDVRADRLALAGIALRSRPVTPIGESTSYSNVGYMIAAAMLETRTDAAWEELMRRHVFAPLGMTGAGFGAPRGPSQPAGHVKGPDGTPVPVSPDGFPGGTPPFSWPSGGVHAPLGDLLRFLAAHRDRSAYLSPASWDTLHIPPFGGDYAMGWNVRRDGLYHNGSTGAWFAEMLVAPSRGVAAAAACNFGPVDTVIPALGAALAGAIEAVA